METLKPLMRGYIHQVAFFIALGGCALLIVKSHNDLELISNLIYSLCLVGLYGVSALYHTPVWGHRVYILMRRLDHAVIFALIAGSATPICMLGVQGQLGFGLTMLIWIVALFGMLIAVFWSHRPQWVGALVYIFAGWLAFPYVPEIAASLGMKNFYLLLAGGVIYTIGAILYACKWPDPVPHIFGYHEIFHILVVIASILHFTIIYNLTI